MWDKPVWLDSGNFSVRVYLPLIWMFSATHMHSLTVYVITGLPFARYLSQESSPASNLCFWLALSHSAFFFLYLVTFFLFIHGFSFYFIKHRWHSLDQHLLKCLSLETLTSMIRTGSPILVEMVDLVNFVISNKRTQMVNFPTQIWEFDSHNPAILDFFFFLTLVFVLQWLSLPWEILIMLLSQFPLMFHEIHNGMPVSLRVLWVLSCWLGWSLWSFEGFSMGGYL